MTVRRLKTYTAESGHVYEYYFVGKRTALADDPFAPSTEFVFDITHSASPSPTPRFAVSIFLRNDAVREWERQNGRSLADAEQYAAAKMMLLRAFDQIENLVEQGRRLPINASDLQSLLESLGVD